LLHKDDWLSGQLRRPTFSLAPPFEENLAREVEALPQDSFAYTRVPAQNSRDIHLLQNIGFQLVDTTLIFRGQLSGSTPLGPIRAAEAGDEECVAGVAKESYRFSRFHLDPRIPDGLAGEVKAAWVRNFFHGKRGDALLIAESEAREVAGFLLAICKENEVVIDLIAVSPRFQRQGHAANLVRALVSRYPAVASVSAGTQAANIGSARFYESLGFRLSASAQVFHLHK
jgi:GNAT superfamily N-acetyltransferase